jgi:uncharacterized protein YjdB
MLAECANCRVRLLLLVIALSGCSEPPGSSVAVPQLSVEPAALALLQGDSAQLAAVVRQGGAVMPGATVTWRSEAPAIATVSADGRVAAVGVGSTRVSALSGVAMAQVPVTVVSACRTLGVTVRPASAQVRVGAELYVSAMLSCTDTVVAPRFLWSSTDTSIASVDTTGRVVGRRAGTAVVVATLAIDSTRSAAMRLEVQP